MSIRRITYVCLFLLLCPIYTSSAAEPDTDNSPSAWDVRLYAGTLYSPSVIKDSDAPNYYPLFFKFDLSYYGERLFFDDGLLGFNLYEKNNVALSAIVQPIFDSFYFNFISTEDSSNVVDRNISFAGGIEAYFVTNYGDVRSQAVYDVTNVHNGYLVELAYAPPSINKGFWELQSSVGMVYKSEKLLDYYYSVRANETQTDRPNYVAHDGIDYFLDTELNYQWRESWVITATLRYDHFSESIANSPLVDKQNRVSIFLGLGYEFN